MNESQWLKCEDPYAMLACLEGRASKRKLRLFACACYRRIWHLLTEEESRRTVEFAESHADGLHDKEEWADDGLGAIWAPNEPIYIGVRYGVFEEYNNPMQHALDSAYHAAGAIDRVVSQPPPPLAKKTEYAAQATLLRDIFGNPFHPIVIDPAWLAWGDSAVVRIAQAIYGQRRFEDLPILADALEDGGCVDEALLSHCRSKGEHVRGCYVLDAIQGKA